jgi:hypothetical protein
VERKETAHSRGDVAEMTARRNAENGGMKEEKEMLLVRMNYGTIFSYITLQCFNIKLISNIVIMYPAVQVNHVIYECNSVVTAASREVA